MTALTVERIESLAGFRAIEHEWRAFEERLVPLPFGTFDWNLAWWEHMHAAKLGVRDHLFIHTFRNRERELCGIAPMMRTRRPGVGPLSVRQLQFIGADPNITEIRGVLAPPDTMTDVVKVLWDHLREHSADWDWLQLSGLPASDGLNQTVENIKSSHWVRDVSNFYLELPATWAEFKTQLSRNVKESLRKCYNAPKRDGVTFDFTVQQSPSEVGPALDVFFRLHEARASATEGVKHGNVFRTPQARQFLIGVCQRFAARDALRVFQLKLGDRVIATRIGFVLRDSLYLYYSGYDPEYGKYSVMTTTVAEAIQYAIAQGFATINLSTGNDISKQRWSPRELIYRDAMLWSPSMRGAVTRHAYGFARERIQGGLSRVRILGAFGRSAG